jgi:hypothetical protein
MLGCNSPQLAQVCGDTLDGLSNGTKDDKYADDNSDWTPANLTHNYLKEEAVGIRYCLEL